MVATWGSGRCDDDRKTRVKTAYSRDGGSGKYGAHEYSRQALRVVYVMVLLAGLRSCDTMGHGSSLG